MILNMFLVFFNENWLNFQGFHSNEVLLQSLCLKHDLKKFKTIMVNGYQWPSHDNGKWGAQSYFNYAGRGTLSLSWFLIIILGSIYDCKNLNISCCFHCPATGYPTKLDSRDIAYRTWYMTLGWLVTIIITERLVKVISEIICCNSLSTCCYIYDSLNNNHEIPLILAFLIVNITEILRISFSIIY